LSDLSQELELTTGEWFSQNVEWSDLLIGALQTETLHSDVYGFEFKVQPDRLATLNVLVRHWTEEVGESLWNLGLRCKLQVKLSKQYSQLKSKLVTLQSKNVFQSK
jgi:hypothetical protein